MHLQFRTKFKIRRMPRAALALVLPWNKAVMLLMLPLLFSQARGGETEDKMFFEQQVLPLVKRHCYECHSHAAGKAKGGFVMDSRTALLEGGELGPAIVPGNPAKSLLVEALQYGNQDLQMPPKGKLEQKEIDLFIEWVRRGAPMTEAVEVATKKNPEAIQNSTKTHWAFQPLRKPNPPAVKNVNSQATGIDRFILGKLEAAGLYQVGQAERPVLIRRLYFDLIGLPPTRAEVEAFVRDDSERAVENLVDRLLDRPEFGERWGRYWLDVARYADSNGGGSESNNTHDDAWRYRDYVITAFNENKPFNKFVMEQIAGDLLEFTSEEQRREQLIATGYLLLGPKAFGTGDFEQFRLDTVDEQLDTIGKSLLGLAIGCARCHDHKFDPIPTRDYYAMAGILSSTASVERSPGWRQGRTWTHVPLPIDPDVAQMLQEKHKKEVAEAKDLKAKADAELKAARQRLNDLETGIDYGEAAQAKLAVEAAQRKAEFASSWPKVVPIVDPVPMAMAVHDTEKPVDENIRVRGVPRSKGDLAPRGVLAMISRDDPRKHFPIGGKESGRLELARWLVDPERGGGHLVARVMANRIWGHMIGRPIVESADNFGLTGQKPSHPELLDYLAATFVEEGWSVKRLIKQIVLSRTYQLASADNSSAKAVDPANTLLWRHQIHRLDVEAIRDALLAISGQLDHKRGGPTLQHQGLVSFKSDFVVLDTPSPYNRRTVYLPLLRDAIGLNEYADETSGMLETFDFADPNMVTGARNSTTVPTQALFLMNSHFMREQARATAKRILAHPSQDQERIGELFYLAYSHPPSSSQAEIAQAYTTRLLQENMDRDESERRLQAWTGLCQAVFASNEFLFVN